tara:strand:+ start:626 stop:1255 length:630 start_codon:yes stop_codon:yes gene_type:complete
MKKIGFFGDSFCSSLDKTSWCKILADKLSAEIINLGKPGRSIYTAIFDFLKIKDNNLPDYSIFCWTDPYRLYHKKYIASHNCEITKENENIIEASRLYKLYLADQDKEHLEFEYVIKHFDNEILKPLINKTQILQTWSMKPFELINQNKEIKLDSGYFYNESLYKFSNYKFIDYKIEKNSSLHNHMNQEQNLLIAEKIYSMLNNNTVIN